MFIFRETWFTWFFREREEMEGHIRDACLKVSMFWRGIILQRGIDLQLILDKKCLEFYTSLLTEDPPGEFSIMVAPLPTPPWSVLLSLEQKCSGHLSILFLAGEG